MYNTGEDVGYELFNVKFCARCVHASFDALINDRV